MNQVGFNLFLNTGFQRKHGTRLTDVLLPLTGTTTCGSSSLRLVRTLGTHDTHTTSVVTTSHISTDKFLALRYCHTCSFDWVPMFGHFQLRMLRNFHVSVCVKLVLNELDEFVV